MEVKAPSVTSLSTYTGECLSKKEIKSKEFEKGKIINYSKELTSASDKEKSIQFSAEKQKENKLQEMITFLNNRQELKNEKITIKCYFSKGGSSTCFICESQKFPGKLFILKNIENSSNLTKNLNSNDFKNQIKTEFFLQKSCRCRYITSVNGIFQIDENFLIFSEFELNGDLNHFRRRHLKTDKLSESLVIYFGGMVLKGIEHLHKLKICHFDIKLENILINGFYNAKITDFSISKEYSNFTEYKLNSSGTQNYIAPEQFERKKINAKFLERVDLWALGVVFYKLIHGKFPYNCKDKTKNGQEFLALIKESELEFDEGISEDLKDFISKLLEKNIEKRISIKEALNHPVIRTYNFLIEMKKSYSDFSKYIEVLKRECF